MKVNFNLTHPELREGEMVLTNDHFDPNNIESRREFYKYFHNLKYSSKRMGFQAYANDGAILKYSKPIFISIVEYESYMNSYKS
ncbi:MAG: hypothetical protein H7196_01280 [candidate division SR1 bacterium]|nr:hypothetical protein [candidate division SR1 bacterium]